MEKYSISLVLKRKKILYPAIGLIVVVAGFLFFGNGEKKERVSVVRTDIIQEVAATGKIEPNQKVDMGFEKSGRIANVNVRVGDKVLRGDILASLDTGEISSDIAKAEALLSEEMIKLREIKNTAPISYNSAYKNLEAAIRESFASADNAIRNKIDQFFQYNSANPQFEVSFSDGNFEHFFAVPAETKIKLNSERKEVEKILLESKKRTENLSESNAIENTNASIEDLNKISSFLDNVAFAINTFTPAEYAYEATVASYKTDVSSARSQVSGAVSDLVLAKDKFNEAPRLGDGGQFENVLVQEAKVSQARAALAALESSFGDSLIRAPFDGTVTVQDAKVGASVSPNTALISLISENEMYVEANISEIHIGKVVAGNPVIITLDAFPEETFRGLVSYVEPGDIVLDGVVNYKIRVEFENLDPRLKGGLTTNLRIETAKRANVLALPLYAVIREDGQPYAEKVVANRIEKTKLELGLSGNTGLVEVLSGLSEGELVQF